MSLAARTKLSGCDEIAPTPDEVIFGRSEVMRQLRPVVEQIARVHLPVLIYGETGTGKEVLAQYIHRQSPRCNGGYVKISCAAIPTPLLEAELFGYERGAFTGANSTKPGLVEQTDAGTLVLDHLSELDITVQAKLLQLLQDGTFSRIGGQHDLKIDARVICITTRNPSDEIAEGRLRLDLFHRINTGSFRVPELKERTEDISVIAEYLIQLFNRTFGKKTASLSSSMYGMLQRYTWPGNIRELENVIRRYVIMGYPDTIAEDIARRSKVFPTAHLQVHQALTFKARTQQLVREVETQAILRMLHENNWNRRKTAQMLNISYRALLYKIRSAGLGDYSPEKRNGQRTRGPVVNFGPSSA